MEDSSENQIIDAERIGKIIILTGYVSDLNEYQEYILNNFPEYPLIGIKTTDIDESVTIDERFKAGLVPAYVDDPNKFPFIKSRDSFIEDYLNKTRNGMNLPTRYFWYDYPYSSIEVYKEHVQRNPPTYSWFYGTKKFWYEYGEKTGNSGPLLVAHPDLVYSSNRPVTDMKMYQHSNFLPLSSKMNMTYFSHQRLNNFNAIAFIPPLRGFGVYLLQPLNKLGIPVARYSSGASGGLFYEGEFKSGFCGTFYYFEPESTTFLSFNTIAVYPNKLMAYKDLLKKNNMSIQQIKERLFSFYPVGNQNIKGFDKEFFENTGKTLSIFPDLTMTPEQVDRYGLLNSGQREIMQYVSKKPRYVGIKLGYLAKEDDFDQSICRIAKRLGIDVIALTSMVGSKQLVIEILDTRERNTSFASLVYKV